MRVDHILRSKGSDHHIIGPDQPLRDAVASMMQHRIGSLIVTEGERAVSIVTERDVMGAVNKYGNRFDNVRVRDVMAPRLVTCHPDESLDAAMELMMENPTGQRIRHLPVVNGDALLGVISIGDIIQALLTEIRFENRLLKSYIKNWPEPE